MGRSLRLRFVADGCEASFCRFKAGIRKYVQLPSLLVGLDTVTLTLFDPLRHDGGFIFRNSANTHIILLFEYIGTDQRISLNRP